MKNIIASLVCLLGCVLGCVAQNSFGELPFKVEFSSSDGILVNDTTDNYDGDIFSRLELNSVNSSVNVRFIPTLQSRGVHPILLITPGAGGFSEEPAVEIFENLSPEMITDVVVNLDSAKWGSPFMGKFQTTLMVVFSDASGDLVSVKGEPVMATMPCITPNTFPARYLFADPDGKWQGSATFSKFYRPDTIGVDLYFNNVVGFKEDMPIGEIIYTDRDWETRRMPLTDSTDVGIQYPILPGTISRDWNPIDGNYMISVYIYNPLIEISSLRSVSIRLMNMTSEGRDIDDKFFILNNNELADEESYSFRKIKIGNIESEDYGMTFSDSRVDVYNLQGILIKRDLPASYIKALPSGIYIVSGKKIVVQ